MWNNLEKARLKVFRDANVVADMVSDNDQVQSVAEMVKSKTEAIVNNERLELVTAKIKAKTTTKKKTKKKKHSFIPFSKIDDNANGDGSMSEITWADGSTRSMPSLRVFGKGAIIAKNNANRGIGSSRGSPVRRSIESDHDTETETEGQQSQPQHQKDPQKVNLPILIFPGMASSGLRVEESGLDNNKYKGRRLWMNAGFLAISSIGQTVLEKSPKKEAKNVTPYADPGEPGSCIFDSYEDLDRDQSNNSTSNSISIDFVEDSEISTDHDDFDEFAKSEEELQIRSAWLYHVSLDKNMVDERPGNRVRTYEGIKACEWLVDDAISKSAAVVWADTIYFLEKTMGYVRGKDLDAAPYDWRLPPLSTEARDGYLTKTMKKVETMYIENGGLPVVMCCHSMGCRMGHYFLNFCLENKGREWIDRHIHTFMPIGAPHSGSPLTIRLGATGTGLLGFVEDAMISLDEGLIMYRSWGSGPWLIPRDIPCGVFPPCIVRREGELAIKITTEIDVGSLFADRTKPPKELRLTAIFRKKIRASTEFVPLKLGGEANPTSMVVSFDETFYLAVPHIEDDELGSLVFYLEESSGRLYRSHQSRIRAQFQNATNWARSLKKEVTKLYRSVAKKFGSVLRVAVCERPLQLKASTFMELHSSTANISPPIEVVVPFCKCNGGSDAKKIMFENINDESEIEMTSHSFVGGQQGQAIGSIPMQMRYSPPPDILNQPSNCTAKFAMISEDTPTPPVVSRRRKFNTISHDKIVYETWNGRDLFEKDGFCNAMFDVNEDYYEQDPLGPTTKSSLDAPPVNIVRSIYGINVPTEVSAVYRKEPVVIVGDNKADSRFMIDTSATFSTVDDGTDPEHQKKLIDPRVEAMVEGYRIKDGIIEETSEALQNVPGTAERRRCCGDGTVPYWSLVHCLNWKDSIPEVTVDELDGAIHRSILSDNRLHALLQQYCTVDDLRISTPPTNNNTNSIRINGLGISPLCQTKVLQSYV